MHWTSDDENEPVVIAANQLNPGDEVEIRIRGTVNERMMIRSGDDSHITPAGWSPEYVGKLGGKILLVRVHDHPSHDLVGAVRRAVDEDEEGRTTWVKVGCPSSYDADAREQGIWWCIETGEEKTHDDLGETERVGSVPFTAAYRAEEKKS